jgi:hypothetical protein
MLAEEEEEEGGGGGGGEEEEEEVEEEEEEEGGGGGRGGEGEGEEVHLVGFIIRIYHDARSSECKIYILVIYTMQYNVFISTFRRNVLSPFSGYGICF